MGTHRCFKTLTDNRYSRPRHETNRTRRELKLELQSKLHGARSADLIQGTEASAAHITPTEELSQHLA